MANTIEIKFKAVNAPELKNAITSLDKATKSLINSQVRLAKEGKKVKDVQDKLNKSTRKATQRTRILGGTFAVLRSKMLLFQFAMALGVRQLIKFTQQSAKVESMQRAFTTLSGGFDNASISINKLQKATNNTMSEFDLFQQANNAMVLGVSKNSDEMAEMFDIAQRLGRALGRDTASSVESLVTGIGRQSRLMLDNIGIIVKSEEAYEKYAKGLNKTAKELTDTEKKQAFLEATMESARKKVKNLGKETLTTQDTFDQFKTSMSNLGTAIGENLGFFETLASITGKMADNMTNAIKPLSEREELERKLAFHQKALVGFQERREEIEDSLFKKGLQSAKNDITLTLSRINAIKKLLDVFIQEDEKREKLTENEKLRIEKLTEAEKKRAEVLKELAEGMKRAKEEQSEIAKQADLALGFANKLSGALAQATLNGQNMGKAIVNSLKSIAVEMASKAFIFTAFQALGIGGVGTAGKTLSQFLGIAHSGGLIKNNGDIQKFANGGQVQGQDNVPIMAQAGEFVIRKAVVEQVGVDNLAKLNKGEGSVGNTINVNISGGVVDESYVSNELIPALNKASSLGNRINA